jgi:hypothetical protein
MKLKGTMPSKNHYCFGRTDSHQKCNKFSLRLPKTASHFGNFCSADLLWVNVSAQIALREKSQDNDVGCQRLIKDK